MRERGADRDEPGQVFVFAAETVHQPGAKARAHLRVAASMQLETGPPMRRVGAVHRPQDAEVVHVPGNVREKLAHREATLTVRPEGPWRLQQLARLGKLHPGLLERIRLPVVPLQERFGVKRVYMARPAFHEQKYHPLRARRKMRHPCRKGIRRRGVRRKKRLQGEITKSHSALAEKGPPADRFSQNGIHWR